MNKAKLTLLEYLLLEWFKENPEKPHLWQRSKIAKIIRQEMQFRKRWKYYNRGANDKKYLPKDWNKEAKERLIPNELDIDFGT